MINTYDFLATWIRARFGDEERGASLVEYALLVALIAVVCIVAITFLGTSASSQFNNVGSSLNNCPKRRAVNRAGLRPRPLRVLGLVDLLGQEKGSSGLFSDLSSAPIL